MKITFDTKTLRNAVQNAAAVAAGKTAGIPICTHLYFQATETEIRVHATDLETGLSQSVTGEIHESGNCTIPAKRLLDILNHVDGTAFHVHARDAQEDTTRSNITLKAENATFRLTGLPADDFPQIADCSGEGFSLPAPRVLAAMRNALTSAGGQFEGIFIALFPAHLECMATNAMQLTCIAAPTPMPDALKERTLFIQQRAAQQVLHTFKDAETLAFQMDLDNSLVSIWDTQRCQATLRLGTMDMPNHRRLLDTAEKQGSVTLETQRLLATLKRIVHFTNPVNSSCVLQAAEGDGHQLHLSAITPELGEAYETVATLTEPTPVRLGLNARALMKALHIAETEKVMLTYSSDELGPLLIRSETAHEHITLLMPMRLESPR